MTEATRTSLEPGRIWECNNFMLAAAVSDSHDDVRIAVLGAAASADLVVTSGGISMGGTHDSVKAALSGLGTTTFCQVAMRLGKLQGFGVVGPAWLPR